MGRDGPELDPPESTNPATGLFGCMDVWTLDGRLDERLNKHLNGRSHDRLDGHFIEHLDGRTFGLTGV